MNSIKVEIPSLTENIRMIESFIDNAKYLSIEEIKQASDYAQETLDWMYNDAVERTFLTPCCATVT